MTMNIHAAASPYGNLGFRRWSLILAASGYAFVLFGDIAAHADDSLQVAQSSKPPVEVTLCDTGMARIPVKAGERRCPDGHRVRRTLLIPGNVDTTDHVKGADGKNYQSWKISMRIVVTDEGLMFQPTPPNLKRSDIHWDTVWLQPGWPGLYESDLNRAADSLAKMRWSDDPKRKIAYVWNNDRDPDFKVFEAVENTEESGLVPILLPRLLVPKGGEHVFFQCVGPALYQGKPTDPLCSVRDFADPENDGLEYALRYTRIKDWRRYSTWLWDYVNSITVKQVD